MRFNCFFLMLELKGERQLIFNQLQWQLYKRVHLPRHPLFEVAVRTKDTVSMAPVAE